MPVVSQSRFSTTSSTSLSNSLSSGSYRSTLNSSTSLERPFYSSASGSYVRPCSHRSAFSSNSVTEYRSQLSYDGDGVRERKTSYSSDYSRYSRAPSVSDSDSAISCDSRLTSRADRSGSKSRDTSVARSDSGRASRSDPSAKSIANLSSAEFYKKYSPFNYIPQAQRLSTAVTGPNGEANRSKLLAGDAARLPLPRRVSARPVLDDEDSGISRGDSPVTAAQPSSGAANNTGSSTCGTLSSNSGAPSSSRRGTLATHGTGHLSKTSGLNGLRNIGNTCFMNSVVQCLSNTRPLMEYCGDQDSFTPDINTTLSCMKGALIKAFSTVICELWREGESDGVVNTTALKAQIQRFAPRFMGYSQQDAQEFLRYLLEGLHEDVNRVTIKPKPILTEIDDNLSDAQKAQESWNRYLRSEDSRVGDIFVGQLKSSLRCTHCNHTSVTFDPFWDLSLPIPSRTGQLKLTQCLSHFTKEEELDGDEKPTCSKCQVRRKCLKWFTIQKFPRVLVLHLKRFSPQERFRGKLNVLVEFPLTGLDLSHCSATPKHHEYNLYAVSNHSGTTYSGHYTAYCKHPYNGEWHEYNDSRVSPISSKNVVSSEAYVLFYELANSSSASS